MQIVFMNRWFVCSNWHRILFIDFNFEQSECILIIEERIERRI